MSVRLRFKFFLWYFSQVHVPLIGYLKPRLLHIDLESIVICLPLRRRSRNHLGSMYFGALAVGADLAGGFHGFYHAQRAHCNISLVFKSFNARFLTRPESDVYFVSREGILVQHLIQQAIHTKTRLNQMVHVIAYTHYLTQPQEIAHFDLELSIKIIEKKNGLK